MGVGRGDESVGGTGDGEGAGVGGWVWGVGGRPGGEDEVGAAGARKAGVPVRPSGWALAGTSGLGRFRRCHTHHLVSPAAGAPEAYLLSRLLCIFPGGRSCFLLCFFTLPTTASLSCAGFSKRIAKYGQAPIRTRPCLLCGNLYFFFF